MSVLDGYNIIDITIHPVLQKLRDDLFNKNKQAFDLMDSLDDDKLLRDARSYDLSDVLDKPDYILFSSDKPMIIYGKYNKGDIIKVAGDLLSRVIDSSLSDYIKDKIEGLIDELLGIMRGNPNNNNNEERNGCLKRIIEEVRKLLSGADEKIYKDVFDGIGSLKETIDNMIFSSSRLGVYLEGNELRRPIIIIFLNNILNKPKGNEIFDENELYNPFALIYRDIERTYIHELFHMVHLNIDYEVENSDYGDKVVIEGLAKYFEIKYSEKYLGTNAKVELTNLWRNHSVVSYPYAGACYFERFGYYNRFNEIIMASANCYAFNFDVEEPDFGIEGMEFYRKHIALHHLLEGTEELETIIKKL